VALQIGFVVLLATYRIGVGAIHWIVPAAINAQATHRPSGSSPADKMGLYDGLCGWYLRTREGHVETIKALIYAERETRPAAAPSSSTAANTHRGPAVAGWMAGRDG
jgi:hypothetical protein